MLRLRKFYFLAILLCVLNSSAQKDFTISSPDGNLQLRVDAGKKLEWSITHQSQTIITPSSISLTLQTGEVLGANPRIKTPLAVGAKFEKFNDKIAALNYKKDIVGDTYNQLTLSCKGDYGVIFRLYNDGVAYRFFTKKKDSIVIRSEEANFNFTGDDSAYIPYSNDPHNKDKY